MPLSVAKALAEDQRSGDSLGNGQSHNCKVELRIAWQDLTSCLEADRWEQVARNTGKPMKLGAKFYTQQAKRKLEWRAAKPNL